MSGINSLLKYRFQPRDSGKLDNSQTKEKELKKNDSQTSTPTKNSSDSVTVPETPESQRPPPDSPVFKSKKKIDKNKYASLSESEEEDSAKVTNGTHKSSEDPLPSTSTSNSPTGASENNSEEFANHMKSLGHIFPQHSEKVLKYILAETGDYLKAVDRLISMSPEKKEQPKKRKRIRCISADSSDSDVIPVQKKKKAKPIATESQNTEGNGFDSQETRLDTDNEDERIEFLGEAFPSASKKELERVLKEHNWSVDKASLAMGVLIDAKKNTESIKDIQKKRKKVVSENGISEDEESDGDEDLVSTGTTASSRVTSTSSKTGSAKGLKSTRSAGAAPEIKDAVLNDKKLDDYDDDSDDYDSDDSMADEDNPERAIILKFFNEAVLEELMSIPGCSKKKAEAIIGIRPFSTWDDMVYKFETEKQLSYTLMSSCKQIIKVRDDVKKLMLRCEKMSKDMEAIVTHITRSTELQENVEELKIRQQPSILNEKFQLKPYQLVGLNWLVLIHKLDVNGILADEMGLGKTIQSISFLAHLLEDGDKGPHLIIAPSSTLDNWLRELQLWCPIMKVMLYYGSQEERKGLRFQALEGPTEAFNVILTTYAMATGSTEDRALFKKVKFHYVVLDEAHMLKNMASLRYQNLMKIRAKRRLLLTGTPLQNNLVELMSLLCFVMPDLFIGKTDQLKKMFTMITQNSKSTDTRSKYEAHRITQAKNIMKPFVLRRLKTEVLKQLPEKVDTVYKCPLAFEQRELYDDLVKKYTDVVKDPNLKTGSGASVLMDLRKAANHHLLHRIQYTDDKMRQMSNLMLEEPTHCEANPDLIFEDMSVLSDFNLHNLCLSYPSIKGFHLDKEHILDSGKFRKLNELLPDMKLKGDRVLLFSQFTMMMDIIEVYLKHHKYKFLRLDGQTPVVERQELLDRFTNDPSIFVFLLSTKAGGLGINLIAANTVILHDIDFNPYNDKQAEDRCHRVGQTKTVSVYRLIGENTVEEAMLQCCYSKLRLEKDVTEVAVESDSNPSDVHFLLKNALSGGSQDSQGT